MVWFIPNQTLIHPYLSTSISPETCLLPNLLTHSSVLVLPSYTGLHHSRAYCSFHGRFSWLAQALCVQGPYLLGFVVVTPTLKGRCLIISTDKCASLSLSLEESRVHILGKIKFGLYLSQCYKHLSTGPFINKFHLWILRELAMMNVDLSTKYTEHREDRHI